MENTFFFLAAAYLLGMLAGAMFGLLAWRIWREHRIANQNTKFLELKWYFLSILFFPISSVDGKVGRSRTSQGSIIAPFYREHALEKCEHHPGQKSSPTVRFCSKWQYLCLETIFWPLFLVYRLLAGLPLLIFRLARRALRFAWTAYTKAVARRSTRAH